MSAASPLQPIDPASLDPHGEQEKQNTWIVRKIVQSMAGRIVVSAYQTLRATGSSVICLSPWGDSNVLILPCIRFRDLAIHTVVVATGGAAAIASPLMGSAAEVVVDSFGSSILVDIGIHAGSEAGGQVANWLLISKPVGAIIPAHSSRLETTALTKLLITLKFKHILTDASLGFYRVTATGGSSVPLLFSNIKDYFAVEKAWFSPYLFASARRPLIPRSMDPDVVFCHGPWLKGDYSIGETLLKESSTVVALAPEPVKVEEAAEEGLFNKALKALNIHNAPPAQPGLSPEAAAADHPTGADRSRTPSPKPMERLSNWIHRDSTHAPSAASESATATATVPQGGPTTMVDRVAEQIASWKAQMSSPDSKTETVAPTVPVPPPQRRMVVLVVGISPHRAGLWTSSARPGESTMNYTLLNGCVALVVPVKPGTPLISWHAKTLKELHGLPGGVDGDAFKEEIKVLLDYIELCVDEERITLPPEFKDQVKIGDGVIQNDIDRRREAVRAGVEVVLAGAVRSKESAKVRKDVDIERAGIVMFRIP